MVDTDAHTHTSSLSPSVSTILDVGGTTNRESYWRASNGEYAWIYRVGGGGELNAKLQ
jgi:hypothetical protein